MTKGSYESINYSLRPAKSAERKMLCEAMMKLIAFDSMENYTYIGLGSTYFSDFYLIHKTLGIRNMTSIEKDIENKARFDFNRPYSCIDMQYDLSENYLPTVDWQHRHIIWLDYDDRLDTSMLTDINTFISNACSGSMFIISCNAHPDSGVQNEHGTLDNEKTDALRFKSLINRIGRVKIPTGTEGKNLTRKSLPQLYYKVIHDEIDERIKDRNLSLDHEEKLTYYPLFNFIYTDGAQMLTVGGIIVSEKEKSIYEKAKFETLSFVRASNSTFRIETPCLTVKEIKYLDYLLHSDYSIDDDEVRAESELIKNGIPVEDIRKYAKIYRYFSNFAESIF